MDTLKCLISSSIEDSIPRLIATPSQPIFNAVAQPSQPPTDLLSPPAPSSLFDHLPEKTINSITNAQQCQVAIPPTRSAEISTATKPAPPNRIPTSTDATNPAAMEHIPPLTTTQSLLTHLIKDDNVVSYLENKTAITPVNVDRLETELFNYPFEPFVTHLLQGFRFGFRIGYDGPRQLKKSKICNVIIGRCRT